MGKKNEIIECIDGRGTHCMSMNVDVNTEEKKMKRTEKNNDELQMYNSDGLSLLADKSECR